MKYAFRNGYLLTGQKDMTLLSDRVVFVENGKITDIQTGNVDCTGYEVIDLQGQTLLPGLINMHVHLPGSGIPKKNPSNQKKLVKLLRSVPFASGIGTKICLNNAKLELYSGVTTLRSVGTIDDYDSRCQKAIHSGKADGPRILASNFAIAPIDGHMVGTVSWEAKTLEEAEKLTDDLLKSNPDLVKIMITGGVLDAKTKGGAGELKMAPEMIKLICDKAHEKGLIVAAHVESTEGLKVALENGVDSIEHGAKPTEEIIQLFKDKNAVLCCTLSPALPYALFDPSVSGANEMEQYNGKMVFEGIQECAKACLENDIPVALGNDVGCPYITHYDFWRELVYFQKYCNVTPAFALYSATLGNAKIAKIDDVTGSIEVGKSADMIVVKGNPLEDLHVLKDVKMVMARGKLISNPTIDKNAEVERELAPFM